MQCLIIAIYLAKSSHAKHCDSKSTIRIRSLTHPHVWLKFIFVFLFMCLLFCVCLGEWSEQIGTGAEGTFPRGGEGGHPRVCDCRVCLRNAWRTPPRVTKHGKPVAYTAFLVRGGVHIISMRLYDPHNGCATRIHARAPRRRFSKSRGLRAPKTLKIAHCEAWQQRG